MADRMTDLPGIIEREHGLPEGAGDFVREEMLKFWPINRETRLVLVDPPDRSYSPPAVSVGPDAPNQTVTTIPIEKFRIAFGNEVRVVRAGFSQDRNMLCLELVHPRQRPD